MNNKFEIDKESKRRIKITIFGVIGLLLLVTGVSFATFSANLEGTKVQSMTTGCLKVDMVDEGALNIENAMPETDESGLSSDPYVYTLTNSCTTTAFYTTTINVMNTSNLDNISKMKVALDGDSYVAPTLESNLQEIESVDSETPGISKTYKLDEGYLKVGETKTFNLRTWIDYDVTDITGGLENKIIVLSEAREGKNIEYKTNTSGYNVLKNNDFLTNAKYSEIATSESGQTGIVKVEESNNIKYYFRGNPSNNLTFAGKNFKVLSTNNDGSINIVLDDTIGTSTYGNIKTTLNDWYETNIKSEEEYVKTDQTYCEEKNESGEYSAKTRVENKKPQITCQGSSLTKVGLLTADDLMFAGAVTGKSNTDFYLKSNTSYYTSSYDSANSVYAYIAENSLTSQTITGTLGVKPVITLKSNVIINGNGSETTPFYINGLYENENEKYKDSKEPVIDYARVDEKWSNENKHIEISAHDNSTGSGVAGYLISTTNTKPSVTDSNWEASSKTKYTSVNTYDNGTYYVFVKDNNGNISESKELIISKVDKVAPTCTIKIDPNGTVTSYKTLSIQSDDKNIDLKGYSWDHTTSNKGVEKVNANGMYTGHIKDLAGNQGSCSGVVTTIKSTGSQTIIEKVGTDGLVEESHPKTEQLEAVTDYRYTGKDPNNYVSFNNELWRIIGVFPTEDETGKIENRIKIIRNESIGNYNWNSNNTNDWSTSSLQQYLNGDYYTGLTEEAKGMIGESKYYLGETVNYKTSSNGLTSHFYSNERGTKVYSGNPTNWTGKIGLMYPSDYGYATSGGSTTNREACLEKMLYRWDSSSYSDCKNNDWLLSSSNQWTQTPYSSDSNHAFYVLSSGYVFNYLVYNGNAARPVLTLESTVGIIDGTGTSSDPYILKN